MWCGSAQLLIWFEIFDSTLRGSGATRLHCCCYELLLWILKFTQPNTTVMSICPRNPIYSVLYTSMRRLREAWILSSSVLIKIVNIYTIHSLLSHFYVEIHVMLCGKDAVDTNGCVYYERTMCIKETSSFGSPFILKKRIRVLIKSLRAFIFYFYYFVECFRNSTRKKSAHPVLLYLCVILSVGRYKVMVCTSSDIRIPVTANITRYIFFALFGKRKKKLLYI